MWFENPLWLLAIIVIVPLLISGNILDVRKALKGFLYKKNSINSAEIQIKRMSLLRILAIVSTILAIAGTSVLLPTKNRKISILIDVSESIGNSQVEKARQAIQELIKGLRSSDRISLTAFAGHPHVIFSFSTPHEASRLLEAASLDAPDPNETDIKEALLTASEPAAERTGGKSILLFSDGRSTAGGSIEQALPGIPVNTVPIGQIGGGMVSRGLKLPETAHLGEKIEVLWNIYSSAEQKGTVYVKEDEREIFRKPVELKKGLNSVPIIVEADTAGYRRFDFEMMTEDGQPIKNMDAAGLILIEGKASVLLIHGKNEKSYLPEALKLQGIDVRISDESGIPEIPGFLSSYSAVILDDVPATLLSEKQQEALQNYTSTGGGLFVIGGDSSLGRGEYYGSTLEDILPVNTDTRQRFMFNRAEIVFVLDHSGSMSEKVGKTTKYAATLQGVAAAVKKLNPGDQVAILAFDDQVNWMLPLTPASKQKDILKALSSIGRGGGTDMGKAFNAVLTLFPNREPVLRHMIVITDGETIEDDFQSLSRKLRDSGFSITTIGIGNEINEILLHNISIWGMGKFYKVEADRIPAVIEGETVRATREMVQEGKFTPAIKTPAGFISEFYRGIPPIKGYLLTKPKNLATVYLETGEGDPLLVSWRYGNGKVAVFTGDSGSRWLSGWYGTKYYNYLFSQTIRYIERSSPDNGLRVTATAEASTAHLVVNAVGFDRRLRSGLQLKGRTSDGYGAGFQFHETAPGRYEADVSLTNTGLNIFDIAEEGGTGWTKGWIWNPRGIEMDSTGPDIPILSRVSSRTGGNVFTLKKIAVPKPKWSFEPVHLQNFLLILALMFFLTELFLRSASMNQLKMARAVLDVWWSVRSNVLHRVYAVHEMSNEERAKMSKEQDVEKGLIESRKTREAFRYLAERSKNKKDET